MTKNVPQSAPALRRLSDLLVEDVSETSNAEIRAEISGDPQDYAERMRAIFDASPVPVNRQSPSQFGRPDLTAVPDAQIVSSEAQQSQIPTSPVKPHPDWYTPASAEYTPANAAEALLLHIFPLERAGFGVTGKRDVPAISRDIPYIQDLTGETDFSAPEIAQKIKAMCDAALRHLCAARAAINKLCDQIAACSASKNAFEQDRQGLEDRLGTVIAHLQTLISVFEEDEAPVADEIDLVRKSSKLNDEDRAVFLGCLNEFQTAYFIGTRLVSYAYNEVKDVQARFREQQASADNLQIGHIQWQFPHLIRQIIFIRRKMRSAAVRQDRSLRSHSDASSKHNRRAADSHDERFRPNE